MTKQLSMNAHTQCLGNPEALCSGLGVGDVRASPGLCGTQSVLSFAPWAMHSAVSRETGNPDFYVKLPYLENAAVAKSLQLCPTLCDPIDGSPPGSPIPGILQARTLEWVVISFSNA